jgi:hypothetical protein
MNYVSSHACFEGIAIPGIAAKIAAPVFEGAGRPIVIHAAEIAAAAAVARAKRGAK